MRATPHGHSRTCAYCRRMSRCCRSRPVIALRPASASIGTSTIGVGPTDSIRDRRPFNHLAAQEIDDAPVVIEHRRPTPARGGQRLAQLLARDPDASAARSFLRAPASSGGSAARYDRADKSPARYGPWNASANVAPFWRSTSASLGCSSSTSDLSPAICATSGVSASPTASMSPLAIIRSRSVRPESKVEADAREIRFYNEQGRHEAALLRAVGADARNCGSGGAIWHFPPTRRIDQRLTRKSRHPHRVPARASPSSSSASARSTRAAPCSPCVATSRMRKSRPARLPACRERPLPLLQRSFSWHLPDAQLIGLRCPVERVAYTLRRRLNPRAARPRPRSPSVPGEDTETAPSSTVTLSSPM